MNMEERFRFEDYTSGEDAEAALNHTFPPGTPSKSVLEALGAAGAKCHDVRAGLFACQYSQKSKSFVQITWGVAVETDANGQVKGIGVRKSLTGP